ncbi:MAG: hypothetical protein AUI04_04290 [Candidatus Rokubacteria bacterium 13_2_20CM_2_64_8]|nr:MAG: hypothetical protein AUI04_04290 [Candidatus Rokubacteria bacterium 13_2_20CM_2_64_8]
MTTLLDVHEIETAYGLSRVLFGVSIAVNAGECVCLLGRNGVGKTTTMRSIMGLTPPQAGRVVWKGTDITGWPPYHDFSIDRVFDLFPKLRELTGRNGGFLSGGEQQMLTIARTLMGNPELLLLDEPSEGLAPIVVDHLGEQIARLKREGLTILLAEQNVEFSLALADRVYVLEKGALRFSGPSAALRDNEALRHELLAL